MVFWFIINLCVKFIIVSCLKRDTHLALRIWFIYLLCNPEFIGFDRWCHQVNIAAFKFTCRFVIFLFRIYNFLFLRIEQRMRYRYRNLSWNNIWMLYNSPVNRLLMWLSNFFLLIRSHHKTFSESTLIVFASLIFMSLYLDSWRDSNSTLSTSARSPHYLNISYIKSSQCFILCLIYIIISLTFFDWCCITDSVLQCPSRICIIRDP